VTHSPNAALVSLHMCVCVKADELVGATQLLHHPKYLTQQYHTPSCSQIEAAVDAPKLEGLINGTYKLPHSDLIGTPQQV